MENYYLRSEIHLIDSNVVINEGDYVTVIDERLNRFDMWLVTQINTDSIEIVETVYDIDIELKFKDIREIVRVATPCL